MHTSNPPSLDQLWSEISMQQQISQQQPISSLKVISTTTQPLTQQTTTHATSIFNTPHYSYSSPSIEKPERKKAIMYIDLDNYPIRNPIDYQCILDEIDQKYNFDVIAKKVFGDLMQFCRLQPEFQFSHTLIHCPKVSSRKNTTDIALTIEVVRDLERKKAFDVFIIASSDSDFVPVVRAIREEGKECWVLPSHTTPHETLITVCTGVLQVRPTVVDSATAATTTATQSGVETSAQKTSPRKETATTNPPPLSFHSNATNLMEGSSSMKKPTVEVVKNKISGIIRKIKAQGVERFNMSFVHERLREQGILYSDFGYVSFKVLFEEWKNENPQFKFKITERSGELIFQDAFTPTLLKRNGESEDNSITRDPVVVNKPFFTASVKRKNISIGGVKNSISVVVKKLFDNLTPSFNMSFVHERLREQGILYSDFGYPSFKILFEEWKNENPEIKLGTKKRSGELFFVK